MHLVLYKKSFIKFIDLFVLILLIYIINKIYHLIHIYLKTFNSLF